MSSSNNVADSNKNSMLEGVNVKGMMFVLFCAAFIATFNENIINVALADIMSEFSITSQIANWLVTGYMIVGTVVVAGVSFILRRFKLKNVFFAGCFFLIVGSGLAFIAPTFPLLLACRLFQAFSTGIFIPTMMNTILQIAPKKQIGSYLAIGSCCITFGPALGPVVSGFMVTTFEWRAIFAFPFVSCIIVCLLGTFFVKSINKTQSISIDIPSLVLSCIGLMLFVYGISVLATDIYGIGILILGAIVLAVFIKRQGQIAVPFINLNLCKNKFFLMACFMALVAMMTTFSLSVLLPLYFEQSLEMDAFTAGLLIVLPVAAQAVMALVSGKFFDKRGGWPVLPLGFFIAAIGLLICSLSAQTMNALYVVVGAIVAFGGVGLCFSPSQTAGLSLLSRDMHAHGVTIMNIFVQIAASVGPSLYVGVLTAASTSSMQAGASHAESMATGLFYALIVAAIVALIGVVISTVQTRGQKTSVQVRTDGQLTRIEEIMETEIFSLPETASALDALRFFRDKKISTAPIINANSELIGIVSDGDIFQTLSSRNDNFTSFYAFTVELGMNFEEKAEELKSLNVMEVATKSVMSANVTDSLSDVCSKMVAHHLKKVPVLSNGNMVGVLNRSDITRYAVSLYD